MAAFGSGESGGDGSPPGSSGGSGRSVSKCRGLCSLSFFTGFGGRISFGLNSEKLIQHKSQSQLNKQKKLLQDNSSLVDNVRLKCQN